MASVTLRQHPTRHHLDSEKLFFRKLENEGKKLMRKPSQEKMTCERAASAAVPGEAAQRVPSNQQPCLGTASEMYDCIDAEPPRNADQTAYRVPAAPIALECRACSHANENNNGIIRGYFRRSSTKNINELSPRSRGKRVKFRSQSADGDTLEGIQLERLTQGKTRGRETYADWTQQRRQAWSIFDQNEPSGKEVKGEGHLFALRRVTQDWCDACNRLIKSTARQCECKNESFFL
ncbi:hypothetical protein Baya_14358 [Bagarius yarrelli]|uniref:Uncharacterized protein n=1 Tax=Bagarius yarrelli TaxID=175774 RepID=A0A556V9A9_BAGYA|nr:hypothetical protein Baya_14358 [Bagarius yarrelli]